MTPYLVYDVFTDVPFGGNQLAVFPDATAIPEECLQSIAREFNFSEVTFVYPPKNPSHTAMVRIFTPTTEIDFAGHPLIGTLCALADLGHQMPLVLELGIGPIKCAVDQGGAASFVATQALEVLAKPEQSVVAQCLGLTEADLVTLTHAPIQISLGLPFVCVEVKDRRALSMCVPKLEAIKSAAQTYPAGGDFALFVYTRNGAQITSRMFAPLDNILEDPATGSASATLATYLTQLSGQAQSFEFNQGEDMGRPSQIFAETYLDTASVKISGRAVQTMYGNFMLPA